MPTWDKVKNPMQAIAQDLERLSDSSSPKPKTSAVQFTPLVATHKHGTRCARINVNGAVYQPTRMGDYELQPTLHDGRAHYLHRTKYGGIDHMFFFKEFGQWAVGPILGKTPVFMYVSDDAASPDAISELHQWFAWDGRFWQSEPSIAVTCVGYEGGWSVRGSETAERGGRRIGAKIPQIAAANSNWLKSAFAILDATAFAATMGMDVLGGLCVCIFELHGVLFERFGWWTLILLLCVLQTINLLLALVYAFKIKRDAATKLLKDQEESQEDEDEDSEGNVDTQPTSWITYVVILAFAVNELGLTVLMSDMGTYYETVLGVGASTSGLIHGISNAIGVIFLLSLGFLPKWCALGRPLNLFAAELACVVSLLVFTIPVLGIAIIGHASYVVAFVNVCTTANTVIIGFDMAGAPANGRQLKRKVSIGYFRRKSLLSWEKAAAKEAAKGGANTEGADEEAASPVSSKPSSHRSSSEGEDSDGFVDLGRDNKRGSGGDGGSGKATLKTPLLDTAASAGAGAGAGKAAPSASAVALLRQKEEKGLERSASVKQMKPRRRSIVDAVKKRRASLSEVMGKMVEVMKEEEEVTEEDVTKDVKRKRKRASIGLRGMAGPALFVGDAGAAAESDGEQDESEEEVAAVAMASPPKPRTKAKMRFEKALLKIGTAMHLFAVVELSGDQEAREKRRGKWSKMKFELTGGGAAGFLKAQRNKYKDMAANAEHVLSHKQELHAGALEKGVA
eukprot:g154.t1